MKSIKLSRALMTIAGLAIVFAWVLIPSAAQGETDHIPNVSSPQAGPSGDMNTPILGPVNPTKEGKTANEEYWTPERMKAARPMDFAFPRNTSKPDSTAPHGATNPTGPAMMVDGFAPGESLTSQSQPAQFIPAAQPMSPSAAYYSYPFPYTRSGVQPSLYYTWWPWSTNGKLFGTVPGGGDYQCSATSVTSGVGGNDRLVWTAGHCVTDGAGHWYTNYRFCPGRLDGNSPVGCWSWLQVTTPNGWFTYKDYRYDQAVIVTADGGSTNTRLARRVGTQGLAWNMGRVQLWWAFGYPAAAPFSGERMTYCTASLASTDRWNGIDPETNGIGCDMTPGSSGGGWIMNAKMATNGYLNGVNSYGYYTEDMYSPYFGAATGALWNAVRTQFP